MSMQSTEQSINNKPQSTNLDAANYLPDASGGLGSGSAGRGPSTAVMVFVAILVILLFVGFVALAIWLAATQAPTVAAVRDILIIVLALESCIFGVVIMLLLIMVMRLVNMLEFEIKPILEKTNETVSTLQGTTTFVSQNVVKPAIRTTAQIAGVRQALKTLFGNPRNNIK